MTHRFDSPCPHRPQCPGCTLIEKPYSDQMDWKDGRIRELLPEHDGKFQPFIGSKKHFEYRNRAKLVVGPNRSFGLYRAGTHKLVHIPHCLIHMDQINELARRVMKEIDARRVTIYDERNHKGLLRYLILRQSKVNQALLLGLVTRTKVFPGSKQLARALRRKIPGLVGVVQNVNPEQGSIIEGNENVVLDGNGRLDDQINSFRLRVSLTSFLQGNHTIASLIYRSLASQGGWDKSDLVFDLYSGIGVAGLHISGRVKQVVGIEANTQAVEDGRLTVKANQKTNISFFAGPVEEMLNIVQKRVGRATGAILNPPRQGCAQPVIEWLNRSQTRQLAYLSCSPKSLGRDLKLLGEGGFRVSSIQGFDMYPQTDQIECLAFLNR